ncbi:MAG: hypothetical protein JSU94_02720 [Phycisphaerales bacterium]|nr:MAG: hypothetical protein JSU94_02720 [Phycisphaerales bacterium]
MTRFRTIFVIIILFFLAVALIIRHATTMRAHLEGAHDPQRTFKCQRPPLPNFRKSVNYVAWINQYFAEGKDPNIAATYARLCPPEAQNLFESSESLKQQLTELMRGPAWKPARHPEVETFMREVEPYIDLFVQEAQKPQYCLQLGPTPDTPWTGTISGCSEAWYAVHVLLARAWCESEGRRSQMTVAWDICLKNSTHLAQSRSMLLHDMASDVRLLVYQSVRDALHHGALEVSDYAPVRSLLTDSEPPASALTAALYSEWAITLSMFQELYRGGFLNRKLADEIWGLDADELRRARVRPDTLVPLMDEYFVKILSVTEQPLTIDSLRDVRRLHNEAAQKLAPGHPLPWLIFLEPDQVFASALRSLASRRATEIILMLHEYHHEKGVWPDSLKKLEEPDGAASHIDPFSCRPFVYKVASDTFLLYSVSEDGLDNGGKHGQWSSSPFRETEPGTDFVFWPVQK